MIAEVNGSPALTATVPTSTRRSSKRARKTTSASSSVEMLRSMIEQTASNLVAIPLTLTMPAEDWIDLARTAQSRGQSIEQLFQDYAASDDVIEASDRVSSSLRGQVVAPKSDSQVVKLHLENGSAIEQQARALGTSVNEYLLTLAKRDIQRAKKSTRSTKGGAR